MLKIFCHQKLLILTNDEEQYFTPPAEFYQSYIYCKYKSNDDLLKIMAICETDAKLQLALIYHPNINELIAAFKLLHTEIVAAGGIVKNEQDEVLLIERKGRWDLPKGKAEKNETIEQTAIREVMEETGVKNLVIDNLAYTTIHTYKEDKVQIWKTTHWYNMNCTGMQNLQPQVAEKITDVKWVALNTIKQYTNNCFGNVKEILESL
jgi:8-oxo-dGTP pyrophosphatase MutT (NUDIX family)